MREFEIVIHSLQEIQDFVALATVQPFRVMVGNDHQLTSAKSFMGMFGLDYSLPLSVHVDCSDGEFLRFQADAQRLLP